MILEVAQIEIKAGTETLFEAAVEKAKPLFLGSKGCVSVLLKKCVEVPLTYRLFVEWATLEDHIVSFRESENFVQWRALIGDCLATKPDVAHWVGV